jgi:uncharacterized protein (DUF983 family)
MYGLHNHVTLKCYDMREHGQVINGVSLKTSLTSLKISIWAHFYVDEIAVSVHDLMVCQSIKSPSIYTTAYISSFIEV